MISRKGFFAVMGVAALAAAAPARAADALGQGNIKLVKQFLEDVRAAVMSPDRALGVRQVAERYMSTNYVQHAAGFPPGREGYITVMSRGFGGPPPGAPAGPPPGAPPPGDQPGGPTGGPPGGMGLPKDLYFFADGDFVIWVSEMPGASAAPAKLHFNMLRVVNGRFEEHWDSQ